MKIIDKNKDYYDYIGNILGIDNKVIFDRRGSEPNFTNEIIGIILHEKSRPFNETYLFVLEIGNAQYLFEIDKFIIIKRKFEMDEIKDCTFSLLKTFKNHRHYFEKEITFVPAVRKWYDGSWKEIDKEINDFDKLGFIDHYQIKNPILKETSIPSFIDAREVWLELNTYISSKNNDKNVDIVNSDVDKLINHGFDKKTSFRHPVK